MKLLESLQFVQGAVATKDYAPALTHFRIGNGFIRGSNGLLQLTCPINLAIEASPKAATMARAIKTCTEEPAITMTAGKKLSVKAGLFRALIPCAEEPFPEMLVTGTMIALDDTRPLLPVLKALEPFISEDASRPWSRGVLLAGGCAFATNNVVLLQMYLGYEFPAVINLPHATIGELLRIGEEPTAMQVDDRSVTFFYKHDRRMTSLVYDLGWPDAERLLLTPFNPSPVPAGLWEALEQVAPFTGDMRRVYLRPGLVTTSEIAEYAEASVDLPSIVSPGCFNIDYLLSLKGICEVIDLTAHPKPCLFDGKSKTGLPIRGAIIGMRDL